MLDNEGVSASHFCRVLGQSLGKEAMGQYFHHQHLGNTDDKILLAYLNE
jgi:hypothetical protein